MAKLKLKNATAGVYCFNYRSPVSGKMVSKAVEPFSTVELFNGDVDQASAIRLQYPNIPDSDEAKLSEHPIQFIWEGIMPTVEDYQASLADGENKAKANAEAELTATVHDTAEPMTEESDLVVQKAGIKKSVRAHGTQE